jgi:hypothetical protein
MEPNPIPILSRVNGLGRTGFSLSAFDFCGATAEFERKQVEA